MSTQAVGRAPTEPALSLSDQAYIAIKHLIVSCELAPGERLTERTLAKRLQFGLSPIRSALARLNIEGLITSHPRRGYRVTPVTIRDIDDLFDSWGIVGYAILVRAAKLCTPEHLEELRKQDRELREQLVAEGVPRVHVALEVARATWAYYLDVIDRPRLTDMWQRLDADLQRVFVLGSKAGVLEELETDDSWAERLSDPDAAEAIFLGYIGRVHNDIVAMLQSSDSVRSQEIVLGTDAGARETFGAPRPQR